jgi:hypothetical protein
MSQFIIVGCSCSGTERETAIIEERDIRSAGRDTLNWPDTTDWITHDISKIATGLTIKAPASAIVSHFERSINVEFQNKRIYIEAGEESYESEMNSDLNFWKNIADRKDMIWIINEVDMAYYTGIDLSVGGAERKEYVTHSFIGKRKINNTFFYIMFDGITVDGDDVQCASDEDCLTAIMIFESLD